MRYLAVIIEPEEVKRILRHLGLHLRGHHLRKRGRPPAQRIPGRLRRHPRSLLLNQRAALLRLYLFEYERSLQHVGTCLKVQPRSPYFRCLQGVAQIAGGNVERAAQSFEPAYPHLQRTAREALRKNIRRVLDAGRHKLAMPQGSAATNP